MLSSIDMHPTFTAIDFETAHLQRNSICQIGLVRIENGSITEEINQLIRPPENHYSPVFTEIHGISEEHTLDAPNFYEVWPLISDYIRDQTVVAHNMPFDASCLEQTLRYWELEMVDFTAACTYQIYRQGLHKCCEQLRIPLNHHDALSDAQACAELYLRHLQPIQAV